MGKDVEFQAFTGEDRRRYRDKIRQCLDVFEEMLRAARFDADSPLTGLEIELNLVDEREQPLLRNAEVLQAIENPDFQTELGRFNIEINVPPRSLEGEGVLAFEEGVRRSLNQAEAKASAIGAHMVMIGILPTLTRAHLRRDSLSLNPRYQLLSDQILQARGEDFILDITGSDITGPEKEPEKAAEKTGPEHLLVTADSIAPEAACTSTQLHTQVSPEAFAAYWNASQSIAGIQLALAANSPYLLGKELWRETRIVLFEQATDTRAEELKAQGVRPRVWFGERWITSIFDLFEENVRYFPALLPVLDSENPREVLAAGGVPRLEELRLHNGTIYRWNRPVYDVVDEMPHVRVENRVLPAGPTVVDTMANAAFYFGLVRALAEQERPVWSQLSFAAAEENFHAGARLGTEAQQYWPGVGQVPVCELVLRRLLPLAAEGLESWGVSAEQITRLLGIIEGRCLTGRNGAAWLVNRVHRSAGDREVVLAEVMADYRVRMHSNEPVHTWSL